MFADFVLLTTSFPSAGPILKFVLDLMESLSIKVNDFRSPDYYRYLMQVSSVGTEKPAMHIRLSNVILIGFRRPSKLAIACSLTWQTLNLT